jgi:hypothetical protein
MIKQFIYWQKLSEFNDKIPKPIKPINPTNLIISHLNNNHNNPNLYNQIFSNHLNNL